MSDPTKMTDAELLAALKSPAAPAASTAPDLAGMSDADLMKALGPTQPAPSILETAARSGVQGLTFGLADESYGLMRGIGGLVSGEGFGAGYERGVTEFRGKEKAGKEANPKTALAAEIAGGMGTGVGLAKNGVTLMRQGMGLPQMMAAGAVEGGAYGAVSGAANAEGGVDERLSGALQGIPTGLAVGGAVPLVARALGSATRAISPMTIPPERQAMVDVLKREGVPLTAGQATGSKAIQYAEAALGDAPLAGGKASAAMASQADAFSEAAMRRAGASGLASADNLQANYKRLGNEFDTLSARNALQADPQLGQQIGQTLREYDKILPSEQRKIIGNLATEIVDKFTVGGGKMAGSDYQSIRSRLSKRAQNARGKDDDYADAARGLRNALDEGMARSISPDDADAWRAARKEYAAQKVIEKTGAAAGEGAAFGRVSPAQLRVAAAMGDKSGYARGQGDFAELARAGNAIMTPLPNSGTAQRTLAFGGAGGVGAALATGNYPLAIALALGPGAAGRTIMSKPVQSYLGNQALKPQTRAEVEAVARAMLQGGAQTQSNRLLPSR